MHSSPLSFWQRPAMWLPLALAVVEGPWLIVVMMANMGPRHTNPNWQSEALFIASLPAALGLLAGIALAIRCWRDSSLAGRIALILGTLACAAWTWGYASGLIR